jgi:serine/threonine-protein kinase
MADLYATEDVELKRRVAIKVLAERFAGDSDIRDRFEREALTAARLSGEPHIVTIFDVGEYDERPFIVMELLEGGTLADRLAGGAVEHEQALAWLEQAAVALDAAHAKGVVHRDVKPANLLFDARGELHVADFGIARTLDETATAITIAGTVLGTAGYLSPEQASGDEATAASDIYALGVVAYELLVGRRPFQRGTPAAEAAAHAGEVVPLASEQAELPPEVDAVFARALAKDPAYRYQTGSELVSDLRAALDGQAPTTVTAPVVRSGSRRRLVPAAVAAVLFGAGALTAALLAGGGNSGTPASTPQQATVRIVRSTTTVTPPPVVVTQPAPKAPKEKGEHKGKKKHGKD